VARTYAVYQIRQGAGSLWHMKATVESQVYKGVQAEDGRTSSAVDQTRGLVLARWGQPIPAFYHADSGGHTEDAAAVFPRTWSPVKLVGVEDPHSFGSPYFVWQQVLPLDGVRRALAAAGYDPGEADGEFGDGTADALADWQANHSLDETGALTLASFVSYKPGAVIDEVAVAVGDRVQAGGKLATLAPTSSLVASAEVSQLDVAQLKVGQQVTLTFDALDGAETSGTVDEIADTPASSTAEAGTSTVVQYPVTVRIGKLPSGARTGMTGQASVVTASRRNVVVVPSSAVGGTSANPSVQVVEDGTTVTRPVVVGLVTTQGSEILTGLEAGEQVVTGVTASDTGAANQNQQGGGGFFGPGPPGGVRGGNP